MKLNKKIPILSFVLVLYGCQLSPLFDQRAYNNAISLKVESIFLMKKATDNYDGYIDKVEELKIDMEKAYEYEKGRGDINKETLMMWQILKDEQGHLFGGFLKRWENDLTLSNAFVENMIGQVEEAFDKIIRIENQRRRKAISLIKAK